MSIILSINQFDRPWFNQSIGYSINQDDCAVLFIHSFIPFAFTSAITRGFFLQSAISQSFQTNEKIEEVAVVGLSAEQSVNIEMHRRKPQSESDKEKVDEVS